MIGSTLIIEAKDSSSASEQNSINVVKEAIEQVEKKQIGVYDRKPTNPNSFVIGEFMF